MRYCGYFNYTPLETPWGYVAAVWSDNGLWELGFPRRNVEEAVSGILTPSATEVTAHALAKQLQEELNIYFRGFKLKFGVPVDYHGYTTFQAAVLKVTAAIDYGSTLSYGQVAERAGSPRASRAVGGAVHRNRTPIVVPCHRVIGADGSLTGFGGGLDMKKALLMLENG